MRVLGNRTESPFKLKEQDRMVRLNFQEQMGGLRNWLVFILGSVSEVLEGGYRQVWTRMLFFSFEFDRQSQILLMEKIILLFSLRWSRTRITVLMTPSVSLPASSPAVVGKSMQAL
jgi:hypothetical protein